MAKKQRDGEDTNADPTFEEGLAELDQIVRQLESGSLPLAESLVAYERGIARMRLCQQLLDEAQLRVDQLTGVKPNGEPELSPLEMRVDEDLAAKQAGRAQRRGASR
jgi:exodeoxyribonuclease VII small subunit